MEQGAQGDPEPGSLDFWAPERTEAGGGGLQSWREVLEEGDGEKWRLRVCPTLRLEGNLGWECVCVGVLKGSKVGVG